LDALGLSYLYEQLKDFWPKGGPSWDALAIIEDGRRGVILVEAKSHPDEIYVKQGCQAKSPRSRSMIETALNKTKRWLNVSYDANWMGPLYQSANRLAHLYFFREVAHLPAWLVNIYFLSDPYKSTTQEAWQEAIQKAKAELGLSDVVKYTEDVFLPTHGYTHGHGTLR
jgi:hypothetical protein